ncbi:MAG TPA: hypothetical protein VN700_13170 [Vicinamibacterales bacterium]|nr:hypothetical protein [Vicinamibacterales bacterium]
MKVTLKSRLGALALAAVLGGVACDTVPVPTLPTPTTSDLFFTSQLMKGGSTTRSFKVGKAGEVKVLFTSFLPETAAVVNVALGNWNGTTCTPTTSVATAAGSTTAIITTTLAVGEYCLQLADPGVLTKTNDYSLTVTIPYSSQ